MLCYGQMLDRLKAEEDAQLVNALLASNQRSMTDDDRRGYIRGLQRTISGRRRKAAAITLDFARRAGIKLNQADGGGAEEGGETEK